MIGKVEIQKDRFDFSFRAPEDERSSITASSAMGVAYKPYGDKRLESRRRCLYATCIGFRGAGGTQKRIDNQSEERL